MNIHTLHSVTFSPSCTTQEVTKRIASCFDAKPKCMDLLSYPIREELCFANNELLLAGMPVFSGRIPPPCVPQLKQLKGSHTPAIAVVVYGNRAYEDALLELSSLLQAQGFTVVGAGAFIAQHSIFPTIGSGRPDAQDNRKIEQFGLACVNAVQCYDGSSLYKLNIPGNTPYRDIGPNTLIPVADTSCTGCGMCAKRCPVQAIDPAAPQKTNESKCISCTACITICPQKARAFRGAHYMRSSKSFEIMCAQRKEPEVFV